MPRTEFVKCFIGNFDGRRQGLVIASSKRRAAMIAGTSLYDFSRFWSAVAPGCWPSQKLEPYTLYFRPFDSHEPWKVAEGFRKPTREILKYGNGEK